MHFLKLRLTFSRVENTLDTLGGGLHFIKIDLIRTYFNLTVRKKSHELFTITTLKDLIIFLT